MSTASLRKLLYLTLALAVAYGFLLVWQNRRLAPGVSVPIDASSLSGEADRVGLRADGDNVDLQKKGAKWFIGQKPAHPVKVSALLSALERLKFTRTVAKKAANLADYGLDKKSANMLKLEKGGKTLRTLYFGKMASPSTFFLKFDNDDSIYEAEGDLIFEVSQPASGWEAPKPKKKTAPKK